MGACTEGAGRGRPSPRLAVGDQDTETQSELAHGQGPYSRGQHRAKHGKMGGCLEGKLAVITSKID